jgi:membrane protein required for colicin V production
MNGLDYLILAIIAVGALYGSSRGILRIGSSLIAVVAGVYFASLYYARVGGYFTRAFSAKPEAGAVLGYVVVLLAVMVVVAWGGGKLADLIRAVHMSWLDRLAGSVVGAGLGALLAGFAVVLLMASLPVDAPFIRQSELAPHVLEYYRTLASYVPGQVRDAYLQREADLHAYWKAHREDLPGVGASPTATP